MSAQVRTSQVRRFRRDDRDQLTALVNAHARAVVPGTSVPTNRVLAQLEREPGEFVVDPWVAERVTLVAEQRGRITAAVHLLRFRDDADVGQLHRGLGEVRWLLQWPWAPFWPDAEDAGRAVLAAGLALLRAGGARTISADPSLPAPGVYGVPEQWPHIARLLEQEGFAPRGASERVLLADVAAIPRLPVPAPGLEQSRRLGINGVRISAVLGGEEVGMIEVDELGGDAGHVVPGHGVADIGNWESDHPLADAIKPWLLGEAARWLTHGHLERLLAYVDTSDDGDLLTAAGFVTLTTTRRDWRPTGRPSEVAAEPPRG